MNPIGRGVAREGEGEGDRAQSGSGRAAESAKVGAGNERRPAIDRREIAGGTGVAPPHRAMGHQQRRSTAGIARPRADDSSRSLRTPRLCVRHSPRVRTPSHPEEATPA